MYQMVEEQAEMQAAAHRDMMTRLEACEAVRVPAAPGPRGPTHVPWAEGWQAAGPPGPQRGVFPAGIEVAPGPAQEVRQMMHS